MTIFTHGLVIRFDMYKEPLLISQYRFQYHKGYLNGRTENVLASKTPPGQTYFLCHTRKRKHGMKPAKFVFFETLPVFFQNIKFCKP